MAFGKPRRITSQINDLIERGGSDPVKAAEQERKPILLRNVPVALIRRIDRVIKKKGILKPRTAWIIEALYSEVARQEGKSGD